MKKISIIIVIFLHIITACNKFSPEKLHAYYMFRDFELDKIEEDASIMKIVGTPEVVKIPEFDIDNIDGIMADSIFESISVLKLETTEESLIGKISDIFIDNDTIYILDQQFTKSLFRFTIKGKFIDKIGCVGQGPGEYVEPTNFFVSDNNIIILDEFTAKLIYYNKNGEYLCDKKLPFFAMQVAQIDSSTYIFRSPTPLNVHLDKITDCTMWITDENFNIKKTGFHTTAYTNFFDDFALEKVGDNFRCYERFCDSLFIIDNDLNLECNFSLDFGKHRGLDYISSKEKYEESWNNKEYYTILNLKNNQNFIYCDFHVVGGLCCFIYSKKNHNIKIFKPWIYLEKGSIGPEIYLAKTIYKDYFVSTTITDNFPGTDSTEVQVWKRHVQGDFYDVKPDDNPPLVFYKFKDF